MSISRFGANMASLGSSLYVCGGGDEASRLNTAERYDSFNNVWIPVEPMSCKRNGVGIASCGGKLYAIGRCFFIKFLFKHQFRVYFGQIINLM